MMTEIVRRVTSVTLPYKIALAIASFVLLFITALSYLQIKNLRASAELVSQSFMVDKEINNLFSQYNLMESAEFRAVILGDTTFANSYIDYKLESDKAFEQLSELTTDIPEHQASLDEVRHLREKLHKELSALYGKIKPTLSDSTVSTHVAAASGLLQKLRDIKADMLKSKEALLAERLAAYKKHTFITPLMSFLLALFALGVFALAFFKLRAHKNHIEASEAMLQNILKTTDNIMNYYEPFYDKNGKLIDFTVAFANECNRDYLGLEPEKIRGERVSKIFSFLRLNGELDSMITAFKDGKKLEFDRQIEMAGHAMWFHSIISPMNEGLLVTARNTTAQKEAEERLRLANVQLTEINEELKKTEAFLESILGSTQNIIMSFEPINGPDGKIIDFTYLYVNDLITPVRGLTPDNIIGKSLSEISPTVFQTGGFEKMFECYNSGETLEYETQYEHEGRNFWYKVTCVKTKKGITVTAKDFTKEKNALLGLEKSLDKLEKQNLELLRTQNFVKAIIESTDNIVHQYEVIRDKNKEIIDFKILFATKNISHYIDVTPEEVVGKTVNEVYPFLVKAGAFENMVQSIKTQTKSVVERKMRFKDEDFWMRATLVPNDDRITSTAVNITKDKRTQEELGRVNQELMIQNSLMLEAKKMAKIGSYVWNLEEDSVSISDNFYHILGYGRDEFKPTFKEYRSLVHPDDLKNYDKIGDKIKKGKEPGEHNYRIITKDGNIKYLRSKGKIVKKNKRKVLIGIAQDISDLIRTENHLRQRNLELNRSNAELESFNQVVSHDLQEPLRKIQLFISRIEDREKQKLSQKGREYFEKVFDAAKRMQLLIVNLLTYSRIDSNITEDFEEMDLSLLLENIKTNLAETITETKAKINYSKLPIVKGVPFQLEQLFTNLISNALKYKNPKETPRIKIISEKVYRQQITEDFTKTDKHYHKITIVDNGIGFRAENAQKIFEVFQRLHQHNEYSGTGIGLAICKKIVENHKGHIHATSKVGEGSAFIIYLPA